MIWDQPRLAAARRSADVPGTNPGKPDAVPIGCSGKRTDGRIVRTTGDGTGPAGNLPDIGYGTSGKSANAHGAASRKKSGRLGDANRPVLRRPNLRKLYAREDDEIIFPGQSPEYRRHEAIKYDKEARSRRIRSTVITRPDTRKIAYSGFVSPKITVAAWIRSGDIIRNRRS